jgi:hypothetical protein
VCVCVCVCVSVCVCVCWQVFRGLCWRCHSLGQQKLPKWPSSLQSVFKRKTKFGITLETPNKSTIESLPVDPARLIVGWVRMGRAEEVEGVED